MAVNVEIRRMVDEYVDGVGNGWFYSEHIWKRYNFMLTSSKNVVWQRLEEHVKSGRIEKDGLRYRVVQKLPQPIDWQSVNAKEDFPVILPFNLREYVWIDKESLSAVGGSKNSGKTGFLMRTVAMNMDKVNTIFLTNMEGGASQIKRRFIAMGLVETHLPTTYPINDNFHDYIKEHDTLYVIDYIDVPDSGEYFMIPTALVKIQKKLMGTGSIAIVGLQKRSNSDIAYGGEQTMKKATLYVAMNNGKLKIVNAKIHADPSVDPTGMAWSFQYSEEGTNFHNILRCYGDD